MEKDGEEVIAVQECTEHGTGMQSHAGYSVSLQYLEISPQVTLLSTRSEDFCPLPCLVGVLSLQ